MHRPNFKMKPLEAAQIARSITVSYTMGGVERCSGLR